MKTKLIGNFIRKSRNEDGNLEITFELTEPIYESYAQTLEKGSYSLIIDSVKRIRTNEQNRLMWHLIKEICSNENASANDLFNEAETFRQITKQFILRAKTICSYTREKLNEVRVICIYRGLEEEGYISDTQFIEYLKYTDKIIDEILKQVVVLGGEQNSSN